MIDILAEFETDVEMGTAYINEKQALNAEFSRNGIDPWETEQLTDEMAWALIYDY
jgi:hypothetical protein